MSKSRLICTATLDLPDDALAAAKAQTGLLEMWSQFATALADPNDGIAGVETDSRVVKSKPKGAGGEPAKDAAQTDIADNIPSASRTPGSGALGGQTRR